MLTRVVAGCWLDATEVILIEARSTYNEVVIHLKNHQSGFHDRAYINACGRSALDLAGRDWCYCHECEIV